MDPSKDGPPGPGKQTKKPPTPEALALGRAIRERRLMLGLTQPQVAERTNGKIRQGGISKWELGGTKEPRARALEVVAAALETTTQELMRAQNEYLRADRGNMIALPVRNGSSDEGDASPLVATLPSFEVRLSLVESRIAENNPKVSLTLARLVSALEILATHEFLPRDLRERLRAALEQ